MDAMLCPKPYLALLHLANLSVFNKSLHRSDLKHLSLSHCRQRASSNFFKSGFRRSFSSESINGIPKSPSEILVKMKSCRKSMSFREQHGDDMSQKRTDEFNMIPRDLTVRRD